MLTTTVDGLWVLQVLAGIEVMAPELGLRPHLPSVESKELALAHPMAAQLREQGVIDGDGVVDQPVVEWMTVIARRDIGVVINVQSPNEDGPPRRVVLARFAQWWVVLERSDHLVRISPAGTASAEGAAQNILRSQVERLCGDHKPAQLKPVTLDADAMVATVRDRDGMRRFLMAQKLDADQVRMLMLMGDSAQCAQASIVALQTGVSASESPTRTLVADAGAAIIDTPEGRLLSERIQRDRKNWMVVSAGTPGNIANAIGQILRSLPADREWHSYRKVV
jgi:EspG family